MNRWPLFLRLLAGLSLLGLSLAMGQSTFGSITGIVTDPSAAVVPGATVIIVNENEGTVRQVGTSTSGVFSVSNLNVGTYRLRVSSQGFAIYERGGLIIAANQVLNAGVQLTLAQSTTTTVQVTASGGGISTETSNLSNIKTSKDVQELPSTAAFRQHGDVGYMALVQMNPGVSTNTSSANNVQGIRNATGVLPSMDGIGVMALPTGAGAGAVQPSLESVQEVNVQLANTPAEFATAASFTVVTKSGTNDLHGGGFWVYNGNPLNARNFFSATVPFRVYHDFGGSLGGHIRKDKTFFFVDFEGAREAANVLVVGNTPLSDWRGGNFGGLSTTVKDPTTGTPFAGNIVPANRISPVSQKVQDYFFPLPNFGAPSLQSGNWRGQFPAETGFTHMDNPDARIDQNFSNGDRLFGRFSYRRLPWSARDTNLPPVGQRNQIRTTESAVLSWTHLFSPNVLNEARTGYTRMRNFFSPELVGSDIIKQVGIQGVTTTGIHDTPSFLVTGLNDTGAATALGLALDTDFEWTDNLTWSRGSHTMKFGVDVIRDQLGGFGVPNTAYGSYSFTGVYSGSAYADFLLGVPQSTSLTIPTPARYLRGTLWGVYAQDQFKVTRRLTLNYGLRWEPLSPYHDRYGNIANFDPAIGALAVPDSGMSHINPYYPQNIPIVSASKAGFPADNLVRFAKANFYPRIGLAYKPFNNDKTVIRAGYGIYGNMVYGSLAQALTGGPFSGSTTFTNAIKNGVPLFSFPNPFLASGTTSTQNAVGVNPNLSTPYTEQWNVTIEREVASLALRLSYVGSHSVNLIYNRNLNEPPPGMVPFTSSARPYPIFNTITYYDNGGSQRYQSLEGAVARNYGKNLTLNAGWTWAKDLTDTQDSGFTGQALQNQFNRVGEWANNLNTPTQRVYGYVVYSLPLGHGQRFLSSGVPAALLGGWQMSWTAILQSGLFFTPSFSGFDVSNTNTLGGRPDVVPGVSTSPVGTQSITNWFNPAAFMIPGCPVSNRVCSQPANVGRFGNAGIAILRGPATDNADLAISRNFTLHDKFRFQVRANAWNVFNHPNFLVPASNISSPGTVAQITGTRYIYGGASPREVDLQLRVQF